MPGPPPDFPPWPTAARPPPSAARRPRAGPPTPEGERKGQAENGSLAPGSAASLPTGIGTATNHTSCSRLRRGGCPRCCGIPRDPRPLKNQGAWAFAKNSPTLCIETQTDPQAPPQRFPELKKKCCNSKLPKFLFAADLCLEEEISATDMMKNDGKAEPPPPSTLGLNVRNFTLETVGCAPWEVGVHETSHGCIILTPKCIQAKIGMPLCRVKGEKSGFPTVHENCQHHSTASW